MKSSLPIREITSGAAESMLRTTATRTTTKNNKPTREYVPVTKVPPERVAPGIRTYTLREIQEATGVSARAWCVFINQGLLKATKIGRSWLITEKAFQDFMSQGHRFSVRSEIVKRRRAADEAPGGEG